MSQCWGHVGFRSLWLLVVAVLGDMVLACMHAALGVHLPDPGE